MKNYVIRKIDDHWIGCACDVRVDGAAEEAVPRGSHLEDGGADGLAYDHRRAWYDDPGVH